MTQVKRLGGHGKVEKWLFFLLIHLNGLSSMLYQLFLFLILPITPATQFFCLHVL